MKEIGVRRAWTRVCKVFLLAVTAVSVLTFAAAGSISSAASGQDLTGYASASPVAASSARASGQCSKTTALQVMTSYRLIADPTLPQPIAQVLCGPFLGPGSRAMAVSGHNGTCLPFNGWSVFRYANGLWQRVPGGDHFGLFLGIARSGNDIVEKATIRHSGETICTASDVRARVWHWNGSRLVAGPWTPISSGPKTVQLGDFLSPDHKVWCAITKDATEDDAWCGTEPGNRAAGNLATVKRNGSVTVCISDTTHECLQNWDTTAPVLRVGQNDELYGYSCTSAANGVTCTVIAGIGKGKGFLINAAGARKVGP